MLAIACPCPETVYLAEEISRQHKAQVSDWEASDSQGVEDIVTPGRSEPQDIGGAS